MSQSTPKICIPIQLETTQKVLDFMEINQNQADIFEIWIDQIQDLNLDKIFINKKKPILIVCKGKEEKGKFEGTEIEKINLLQTAINAGADYIDLNYKTKLELIQNLFKNKKQAKISLSYHNFELTPNLKTLLAIIQKMLPYKPDIVKIATMANSYKDALIILNLAQALKTAKIPFITIAMGKYGKITRVLSPLMGSEMMFTPIETNAETASGQIEIPRLKELWKEFS